MKPSNFCHRIVSLFFTLFFLSACAGRKPIPGKTETQPEAPAASTTEAPKTNEVPLGPPASERQHVALALGGAGVASFATVGLLKRFFEEGIVVDYIVTTGWPTLFALGYGFLKSVHDLEWFAMRLNEKDFFKAGIFERSDPNSQDKLSALIENSFKQRDLSESSIPLIISAANTELGEPVLYEKGDWKEPFFKTMSVPGLYRPYPKEGAKEWISSLQGIDVTQAVQRGGRTIIAVQMYDDYFESIKKSGQESDRVFRMLYLAQMKKSLRDEAKQATISVDIKLGKAPSDFAARRNAILAGYKEAAKIARTLRN